MNTIEKRLLSSDRELFTLSNVLRPAECAELIQRAEAHGFSDAPITVGANKFMMAPDIRNNRRVMQDDPALAAKLWPRISAYVPSQLGVYRPVGLNERFRYYRYTPGQQFDWHRDGAFLRSQEEQSLLTLIFYLNDDCVGGTTDFMFVTDDELRVTPQRGMALVFSHPLYHRGAPVIEGTKYVLRTDVMYRRG
ncbi:prolyl hydroxylase family protein [Polyangium spumosum]|uniref:2OG-Fe(II) oxygenase n=1 Tax=Polyangium spumosum TaxID=889282 RepID=A0A6N7PUF0_9BACT|nr:2OG-Fe(II) oxygenase [Polyangium spumosum]MRG95862.1 2OG-Fe(II) oxygenase [Polyangium spumosum]